jgi:NDP-sugar pyrophosphorylase family protein
VKFPPVLILAGGLGTRLSAIAGGLPKSMISVNGRPFIARQLELLKSQGVTEVVLCVGHKAEALVDYVGTGTEFGVTVQYSYDGKNDRLLGTGGAVFQASKLSGSPFAVLYGDSWLDVPFEPILDSFNRQRKPAMMTVFRNENRWVPSNLLIESEQVIRYDKANPSADMAHIDFGLTLFTDKAFERFSNRASSDEPPAFDLGAVVQELIGRGELGCFEVDKRFYEVGTPAGLRELEEHLQRGDC